MRSTVLLISSVLIPASIAIAQAPGGATDGIATPKPIPIDAGITAVTVYPGRAAVTRSGSLALDQGLFAVRFENLPATIDSQTLQARVGDGARLVNVEYRETLAPDPSGTPEVIALDRQIEAQTDAVNALRSERAQLDAQAKLVEQIGVRATSDASREGGTAQLDMEALRKLLSFVQGERARLLAEDRGVVGTLRAKERELAALQQRRNSMGGSSDMMRTAEVTIAVPDGGEIPISLTYLVAHAGWEPVYSVRSSADRSAVSVEFDANIAQRSGEDWPDVAMSISTAQPTTRANPPTLTPIFVSMRPPTVASPAPAPPMADAADGRRRSSFGRVGGMGGGGGGFGSEGDAMSAGVPIGDAGGDPAERLRAELAERIESMSESAAVVEGGVAASFELPRRVSVPTDADRMTRTRVATIAPTATFVYTAVPLLTESVYLRGRLTNTSPFQLVPGPAQVFVGPEFVGPTSIGSVAPGGEFDVYFGIDRAIRATRQLVSKNTSESGVFSKSRETVRSYRVLLDNGRGAPIQVELFDRRPVSRDEKITASIESLSTPLSTNAEYLRDLEPQGILRWDLSVPAGAIGATAMPITWTTRVSAPTSSDTTPVPD